MTCPSCSSELPVDATFCGACGHRASSAHGAQREPELDDRYWLDQRIAEGAFGAIYRATHVRTGREVAIKLLHAELAADPGVVARFRREAATLARLRDPHTVTTYEIGETGDGTLFIAMELLHGVNLQQRFAQHGPLPWRQVLAIMRGVCGSLAEAHALGVVHRDIKPANIHLEPEPAPDFVKVLDFGVAKLVAGGASHDDTLLTRLGTTVGTVDYMAPEQLIGETCDARADIYALGVVGHEMMAGVRPFAEAHGPISLITAMFSQPVPALPAAAAAPPAVDGLLARCLAPDPERRFADVGQLAAAIDAVLAGAPARHPRTLAGVASLPAAGPRSGTRARDAVTAQAGGGGSRAIAVQVGGGAQVGGAAVVATASARRGEHSAYVARVGTQAFPAAPESGMVLAAGSAGHPMRAAIAPAGPPPAEQGTAAAADAGHSAGAATDAGHSASASAAADAGHCAGAVADAGHSAGAAAASPARASDRLRTALPARLHQRVIVYLLVVALLVWFGATLGVLLGLAL